MYIYIYLHIYIYIYVQIYSLTYVYIYMYIHVQVCRSIQTSILYCHKLLCVCLSVYFFLCMYVYVQHGKSNCSLFQKSKTKKRLAKWKRNRLILGRYLICCVCVVNASCVRVVNSKKVAGNTK